MELYMTNLKNDLIDQSQSTSIIKKYSRQLFNFIKSKVKNLEDAEDIIQDVWMQFSNMTNISELENISSWLYTVSRNKITDFYRKKKNDSLDELSFFDDDGDFHIREILLQDYSNDPDMMLFREMVWSELMKSLDELPQNQKEVFVQNELEGKTLQQIADDMGENIKTIISRKAYAVKYLRNKLKPFYEELLNL